SGPPIWYDQRRPRPSHSFPRNSRMQVPRLPLERLAQGSSRREFLTRTGGGLGAIAAAWLMASEGRALGSTTTAGDPLAPKSPHFAPRAKRVIYLFMHGGPSHVDLWDPKPDLGKLAGGPLPESFGSVMTRRKVAENPLLAPIAKIRPRGMSGLEVSDLLPHIAEHVDDLCVIRSCHGD